MSNDLPTVWQEVRHRRVGKVVLAYLAMMFAVVEVAVVLVPAFAIPESLWRVGLGALVLGFPAAVVFAWTYDLTATGFVRTPDHLGDPPEDPTSYAWIVVTVLGMAVGTGVHFMRG